MRFVWAVVAFVLATLLIGAGIFQRSTVSSGPTEERVTLDVSEPAPYVLLEGDVLRTHPGVQTLVVNGEGDLFAAFASTTDLDAWLEGSAYNTITLDSDGNPEVAYTAATAEGDAPRAGNPAGSDLWLDSYSEPDRMSITDVQIPEGVGVLIAADGTAPAPSDIVITWPLDTSTPWVGPLITAGAVVLLVGIILYILAIRHQRRGRGPRRKGPPPLPPTEPISLEAAKEYAALEAGSEEPVEEKSETSPQKAERRGLSRRSRTLAIPALMVSATLLTSCTPDIWPQFSEPTPTPTATPTLVAPENQKPPAVSEPQAIRILQSISDTVNEADVTQNIDLAATRLEGQVLDARRTDYTLRAELAERAMPVGIPSGSIELLLPQATEGWPRTVLMLTRNEGEGAGAPVIFTMTQADPWSSYKVNFLAELRANAEVPELAPAWLGSAAITEQASAFLEVAPAEVSQIFADFVDDTAESANAVLFDDVAKQLAQSVRDSRQAVVQGLKDKEAEETSEVSFDMTAAEGFSPTVLSTLDSGAIVTAYVVDTQIVKPTDKDAVIKFEENPEVKTLTGEEKTAEGVKTTYGIQLVFAIPAQGTDEPLRLLAAHQDLLSAELLEKEDDDSSDDDTEDSDSQETEEESNE